MSRRLFLAALGVVFGCGGATTERVDDPWTGTWSVVSVNGVAVPTDVSGLGYSERVVSRTLDLLPGGTGIWKDSTLSALLCSSPTADQTTLCNASGSATVTWSASGDTLIVLRNQSTTVGYVISFKKFGKQLDGTLIRNADGQAEIYRRR
jgi:hypothetical protein